MLKWLKILALLGIVVSAVVVLAWYLSAPWLTEYARTTIENELAKALRQPVALGRLSISFVPLKAEAGNFAVGEGGQVIRFDDLRLRILPLSSLRQARPVGEAAITGLLVDVVKLDDESDGEGEEEEDGDTMFPFRLRHVELSDVRVLIPADNRPFDLSAQRLEGEFGLSPLSRRFSLEAHGNRLHVRRGEQDVPIEEIHLKGAEARDGWIVQSLELSGDDLQATGRLEGRDPPRHSLSLRLQLQRLGLIDPDLDQLSGRLEATVQLTGSLTDPDGSAKVHVDELAVGDRQLGRLEGQLTRAQKVLDVTSMHLDGLGGDVKVEGQLTLEAHQSVQLTVDWHQVDVERLGHLFAEEVDTALSTSGSLSGSGTLDPFEGSAEGSGRLEGKQASPVEWQVSGNYADDSGGVEIEASQTQGNEVRGAAKVAADESLTGELTLQLGDVESIARLLGREDTLPFSGDLTVSAALAGALSDPAVRGDLKGRNLVAFGESVGDVTGSFVADSRHVRSDGVVVDFGDGEIDASGTIGFNSTVANDWQLTIRDAELDRLAGLTRNIADVPVPLKGGRISLQARGSGPWSEVKATGSLKARSFVLADEPIESLAIEVDASWPDWKVDAEMVHAAEERLDATASGRGLEEILRANVHSNAWPLEHLRFAGAAELEGKTSLDGSFQGKIDSLDGQLKLVMSDLVWSQRKLGDLQVDVKATNGEWQLTSDLLEDAVHLDGRLDSGFDRFSIEASWAEAELAFLLGSDPSMRITSTGTLSFSGDLGNPLALGGEVRIPLLRMRSGTLQVEAPEPVLIRASDGRFTIESLTLAGGGTRIDIAGDLSMGGELHVQAEGSGDLGLLELIGDPVQSVGGQFDLMLSVDRPRSGELSLSGTVSVSDATVDVGMPIGMTQTNGRFALEGSRVRIERFAGRIGGGTFTVTGDVDLEKGPNLGWKVVDVGGSLVPSLEQELSGQGTLEGAWSDLTVGGEIEIIRMLYDRNIEPQDFIPTFKRELAPARREQSSNVVRLDLHVFAPDDLHIDNNFARVEAMTDLRVRGTTERPKVDGRIDVLTGEVFFRGRTFEIETGVVDFRPQRYLVADLNITGETVVETADTSYGVTVHISGTTEDPRVVLRADDAGLTQTDMVSLITFGKTVAQLQQGGGGSSMDALLGFATNRVAGGVEKEAESLLRVDRVEIKPGFSTGGTFEPQVEISKDFGDDLSASVATSLGVDLQHSLNLDYRLTDRTSVYGTWESESEGKAGAFGGGVKFRREFRRIPGFSLLGSTEK